MIRRWSSVNETPISFLKTRVTTRLTVKQAKEYVFIKRHRLKPTWRPSRTQPWWLLRHKSRAKFLFLTNWVMFSLGRFALYRLDGLPFSPSVSTPVFLHWGASKVPFFSEQAEVLHTSTIPRKGWKLAWSKIPCLSENRKTFASNTLPAISLSEGEEEGETFSTLVNRSFSATNYNYGEPLRESAAAILACVFTLIIQQLTFIYRVAQLNFLLFTVIGVKNLPLS